MTALAGNVVGAYLQGSLAVGDADLHSDCDFLVVTRGPLTGTQERAEATRMAGANLTS